MLFGVRVLWGFVGTIFKMVEKTGVEWRKLVLDFILDFIKGFGEGVVPSGTGDALFTPRVSQLLGCVSGVTIETHVVVFGMGKDLSCGIVRKMGKERDGF